MNLNLHQKHEFLWTDATTNPKALGFGTCGLVERGMNKARRGSGSLWKCPGIEHHPKSLPAFRHEWWCILSYGETASL